MTTTSITDAARRTVRQQDHVGGTTSGRYQTTITGPVVQIGQGKVKVRVTNRPTVGSLRAQNGDDVWISDDRVFLIHPATERQFTGYRTPDGRVWTQAARVKGVLWEAPFVPERYEATRLRGMYDGNLQPVWEDIPAPAPAAEQSATVVRAEALAEAAARIWDLPQDHELDPGRGDARELLERLAAEAHQPGTYPLVLPWALLMDTEHLAAFLRDLHGTMAGVAVQAHMTGRPQAPDVLEAVERICGTWRPIAEAQHAHNTAPGLNAETTA